MRSKNTELMKEIVDYIDEQYFTNQHSVSVIEIAEHFNMSNGAASKYLTEMAEREMIIKEPGFYGFKTKKMCKMQGSLCYIPVVGEIACGTPTFAEENIEDYITISSKVFGKGEFFVLRAKGDSMIDAGINPGDLVVVKKQDYAEEGQMVAARIDDECTLKTYYLDKKAKKIRLHPHNKNYSDMYFDQVDIQGVAIRVMKEINV